MNKCSIIQDLLTIYVSGSGSEDSRSLVDEHIKTCADCHNKLTELQNRVGIQLRETDASKINVFKAMKKKIFRRNVIVAAIASAVAITLAFGGFWYVFSYEMPIQYEEGLIKVEKNYADVYGGDSMSVADPPPFATITQREVLDIIFLNNYYCTYYGTEKIVNVSGEKVKVVYFYLSETLATSWKKDVEVEAFQFQRLVGSNEDEQFDKMEVYYLNKRLNQISSMNDHEFYEQRKDGVLLWSGTLE